MSFILLIIGFLILIKCADIFVDGCSNIAKALGIPSLIVGLTIVSFGTSAPEAAISVTASIENANSISIGNAVGSNICNMLLVLGFCSLFGRLVAKKKVITRDFIYELFACITLLILGFSSFNFETQVGTITRTSGLILLCFLVVYVYSLFIEVRSTIIFKEKKEKFNVKSIIYIIIGIVGIILGGNLVVDSATKIADIFGVSDNVIALSLIAIGTSLPEMVTSAVAVKKGEVDIAIGNVVGSNIFNSFFVLGLASAISSVTFGIETLLDIIIMFLSSMLVYVLILKNYDIGKKKGILLISLYLIYLVYIILR